MIVQKQLNLINYARIFQTSINVYERQFTIMIDSDATENFMSKKLVDKKKFLTRKKNDEYDLIIINDNSLFNENEKVSQKTKSLSIKTQLCRELFVFDIVRMITHDIVLEMSLLKKYNSNIN